MADFALHTNGFTQCVRVCTCVCICLLLLNIFLRLLHAVFRIALYHCCAELHWNSSISSSLLIHDLGFCQYKQWPYECSCTQGLISAGHLSENETAVSLRLNLSSSIMCQTAVSQSGCTHFALRSVRESSLLRIPTRMRYRQLSEKFSCPVVPHCGFHFYFPCGLMALSTCHVFLTTGYLLYEVFDCSHTPRRSPLLAICITNIFSSVTCLFILVYHSSPLRLVLSLKQSLPISRS